MRSLVVALVLAVSLAPRGAGAAVESDALRAGIAAYESLEYERAVALLTPLLSTAHTESFTREEKLVALRTLAFAQFALGNEAATRSAFEQLLLIDPSHQLDRRLTPRLRALCEETRARVATQLGTPRAPAGLPLLSVRVEPTRPISGRPMTLHVGPAPRELPSVTVYHRSGEERSFSRVQALRELDGYRLELPPAAVRAPALEYYLVAVDPAGVPFAGTGSLGDPVRLAVSVAPRPLYKRAWLWGTVGGVAAAGVLAAVLAVVLVPPAPASVSIAPH